MTDETKPTEQQDSPSALNDGLDSRRLKVLPINRRIMLEIITGKARAILPEGATVNDVMYDWESDSFLVKLRHESFEEVKLGHIIPRIYDVVCEKVQGESNAALSGWPGKDETETEK
jgi:hypothetical protein